MIAATIIAALGVALIVIGALAGLSALRTHRLMNL